MKMRRWIVFGLPVLVAAVAIAWWMRPASPAAKYITAPVKVGELEERVLAIGRVQPKTLVSVGAQVSGLAKRLHVSLGQQTAPSMTTLCSTCPTPMAGCGRR